MHTEKCLSDELVDYICVCVENWLECAWNAPNGLKVCWTNRAATRREVLAFLHNRRIVDKRLLTSETNWRSGKWVQVPFKSFGLIKLSIITTRIRKYFTFVYAVVPKMNVDCFQPIHLGLCGASCLRIFEARILCARTAQCDVDSCLYNKDVPVSAFHRETRQWQSEAAC
jgi:hypothetical protein